jgi:hypothetical protein
MPTAPYHPVAPSARDAAPYLPYIVDKTIRAARQYGYANIADEALVLVFGDLGLVRPVGGFVDSDGVNARGARAAGAYDANGFNTDGFNRQGYDKDGYNADGINANGESREDAIEAMVDGWDADYAAGVLTALAGRVA